MKIDAKFPLWLWLIGWAIMFFAAVSGEQFTAADTTPLTYITVAAWLFVFWPVHIGLTFGEIWLAVQ